MPDDRVSRKSAKSMYAGLDFFMLRAPVLPIGHIEKLATDIAESSARINYKQLDPIVQVALSIGSPSLHERLHANANLSAASTEAKKFLRYLKRMSYRATPFGAFAGIAIGKWADHSDISLSGRRRGRARMDAAWMAAYVRELEHIPFIRKSVRWFMSAEVSLGMSRVRITSADQAPGDTRPVNIAFTPMLLEALKLTQNSIQYGVLVDTLVAKSNSKNRHAVERFLDTLWGHRILATDLMPPVTFGDPIEWMHQKLAGIPQARLAMHQLNALRGMLNDCAALDAPDYSERIAKTRAYARNMSAGASTSKVEIQVDMALELSNQQLSVRVRDDVTRAAETLLRISPQPFGPVNLHNYKVLFLEKYGPNHEVPLTDLIDPEIGLGMWGQLSQHTALISPEKLKLRRDTLAGLAFRAIRENSRSVQLDAQTLANLELASFNKVKLPQSLELIISLVAETPAALDAGNYEIVLGHNVGARSAGQHFGRFADMTGQYVLDELIHLAELADPDDDTIISELVYMPLQLHYANVAIRPAMCKYETPFGATPSVSSDFVVRPSDLAISIRDDEFYVRCVAKNRRVRFRSGHMLNPQNAPTSIQFLNEITRDGVVQLTGFDWGEISSFEFLPQIKTGNIVLSLARWRLAKAGLAKDILSSDELFYDYFNTWRTHWRMPDLVSLTHADNLLPLNLRERASISEIRKELLHSPDGACILNEQLPDSRQAWLPSAAGGTHHCEIVVPLVLRQTSVKVAEPTYAWPSTKGKGMQAPGGLWVYVKLYCARSDQDDLLRDAIYPFIQNLRNSAGVITWFFVRYEDPSSHLRVRIKVPAHLSYEDVFRLVADWSERLMNFGEVRKTSFDTYEQELHRYGGDCGMAKAEAVFCADSNLVLNMLRSTPFERRKEVTMVCVDDMLRSFGMSDAKNLSWLRHHSPFRKHVGAEYRKHGLLLRSALLKGCDDDEQLRMSMATRRTALSELTVELKRLYVERLFCLPSESVLRSVIHMHCNRAGLDPEREGKLISLLARVREAIAALGSSAAHPMDDKR